MTDKKRGRPIKYVGCYETNCEEPHYSKGLCHYHYFHNKYSKGLRNRIRPGDICTFDECDRQVVSKGLCAYHYNKRNKVNNIGRIKPGRKPSDVVGYRGAHLRVQKAKGKASQYICIACDDQAKEWALRPDAIHTYENEKGRVWSMDIDDYFPMCCQHHRKLDNKSDDWFVDEWLYEKSYI